MCVTSCILLWPAEELQTAAHINQHSACAHNHVWPMALWCEGRRNSSMNTMASMMGSHGADGSMSQIRVPWHYLRTYRETVLWATYIDTDNRCMLCVFNLCASHAARRERYRQLIVLTARPALSLTLTLRLFKQSLPYCWLIALVFQGIAKRKKKEARTR